MESTIKIRKANVTDLPILLAFEQDIIAAERTFDPTLQSNEINYYNLEKMILDPNVEVAVAEIETKIVSSGYARIEEAKPYLKVSARASTSLIYNKFLSMR